LASRIKQNERELTRNLVEQIHFLVTSAISYDKGDHLEAKRMAVTLRILLHDTKSNKSLLGLIKLKNILWIDTVDVDYNYPQANLVYSFGLFRIKFDCPSGRVPWLIPNGTPAGNLNRSEFNKWWDRPVIIVPIEGERLCFSRKNIILNIANTDGGAHVDSSLEQDHVRLSRGNVFGLIATKNGIDYPLINPELPSIRQISHEVLLTLQNEAPQFFSEPYDSQIDCKPYGISKETGPPTSTPVRIISR
jgi:hypothetical protein